MRKYLKYFLLGTAFMLALPLLGQRRADIGFAAGIPWYLGDISPSVPRPTVMPPAIGPIFRYNFNHRNSLRAHGIFYNMGYASEDIDNQNGVFAGQEGDFQASFVDLGLDFEFNWWPYKTAWRRTKFSPYVSAGLGYTINYANSVGESVSHLYLPFGGGVKANLGKRLSGGIEISMRKTFTDLIDGVENIGLEGVSHPIGNNDWYMFTGVFLTYKIFEFGDACPALMEGPKRSVSRGGINPNSSKNKRDR
jgi:hypothetical protein